MGAVACSGRACGGSGGLPPERLPLVKRGDGRKYHFLDKGAWKGYYDEAGRLAVAEYDSTGRRPRRHDRALRRAPAASG